MIKSRSLLTDGAWIAALQGLSAVGQLLGMRLLTEVVPPSVFGEVSLWVGAIALVSAAMANPTMQALLRFYPEFHENGKGRIVKDVVISQLLRLGGFALPVLGLVALYFFLKGDASASDLLILFLLAIVDVARMSSLAYLNALRAFKPAGVWALLEAWGRPLLAYLLIGSLGADTTWVLLAYLFASIAAWLIMHKRVPVEPALSRTAEATAAHSDLSSRFWRYSIPLLPLGLIGWVSGMADRYLIGVMLTPADVGLYVAVYGLASRPMAMFGGVIETTIRPAYQHAVARGDDSLAKNYIVKWILLVCGGSLCAVAIASICHVWLAGLLLGAGYRSASGLLPYVVAGYSLLILSHVANRICYAHEATKRVLLIEVGGAFSAVVVGFFCIRNFGLQGAAIAVPVYCGVQLVLAFSLAAPWIRFSPGQR
ncbi:lipopolysaccharide biosynthesis protein [Zoogloea sp.]|uniref:lipopolysaccharide biosynthesis protein n=1 Tax=Zoogloea sp. TaxID=49181 RepID=UPI0025CE0F6F|nr:lipopolysaccharide biosynthesis protein [Zoogloea sp.]MCK6395844.1 lipopolysaccharide biosynthesis protein [Zoogloea sp.]